MQTLRDAPNAHADALPNSLARLFALAAGAAVANSYYNQAMLGHLSRDFDLAAGAVAIIPVLTQTGNALGVLFLAPLGDRLERKGLILATTGALVAALIGAALATDIVGLAIASTAVGLFATVAQQIVPLAVHLAPEQKRGHVLGKVTGGILIGILLARDISGALSDLWGWSSVYCFAAGLMTAIGSVLAIRLPRVAPTTDLTYPRLLASLWFLLRQHHILRQAIAIQFLIFAAFMAFWSNLALMLLAPPYRLGATAVGLMALVGAAGALAAPIAGRFADRKGPEAVVQTGAGLIVAAFAIFGIWQDSLTALIAGVLLMDLGVQSSQIANQARVYALDPNARSRLNTVFMTTMLLGGAAGAGIGGSAYAAFGWTGTCAFSAASAALAFCLSRKL